MTIIHGTCAPGFEPIRDQFAKHVQDGAEIGASFAVVHKGERVIDLWAGSTEPGGAPWQRNTLANVFSTTKGIAAICIAVLVDRGAVSYDDKVSTYWPEFASHGKGDITVAQMLSHQAGLAGFRDPTRIEELYDHDAMAARLAAQDPLWEPTTRSGYHAFTFGFLAGELVKRVTGKTLGTILQEEIGKPHGIDFFIGVPDTEEPRVAPLFEAENAEDPATALASDFQKLIFSNPTVGVADANNRAWRAAELPAANGHGTAAALATLYALLDARTAPAGTPLISPATLAALRTVRIAGDDLVLGMPVRWASGMIMNEMNLYGPNDQAFGHSGWGGSFGCLDPEAGVAIGYVLNQMGVAIVGDPRAMALVAATYACL